MGEKMEKILKIMPSLRRYAFALTGTESGANHVLEGSLERMLDEPNLEKENLENFGIESCRIAWLETKQSDAGIDQIQPAQRTLDSIDKSEIKQVLDKLPSFQRKCLLMSTVGDMSYSEISTMENISTARVNEYISQARAVFINRFFAESRSSREAQSKTINQYPDRHLNALLDNELDSIEATRVGGALNFDQRLAKKLEQLVLVDTLILSHFPAIEDDPVQIMTTQTSAYLH